ncbi:putative serine/threonine protein kinase ripk4 [Penaeus vannamei]|uniref:Putative serine/threonine protein kinase ripk4 n=1 Tax=Penaeus vannamei TaxID=6689 RepID=A0A423SE08_PENVA|nr:putative serine/threonine protein kinase ripk4 [Penaeus vannamei]
MTIDLHGSILDKSSCDTGSRCVSQDVEILLRKSQTLIDRYDHRSEASSDENAIPGVFTNALHLAVDYSAADVVRLLLRYGVEPNRGACVLSVDAGASRPLHQLALAALLPQGFPEGVAKGVPEGVPEGLSQGVAQRLPEGLPPRLAALLAPLWLPQVLLFAPVVAPGRMRPGGLPRPVAQGRLAAALRPAARALLRPRGQEQEGEPVAGRPREQEHHQGRLQEGRPPGAREGQGREDEGDEEGRVDEARVVGAGRHGQRRRHQGQAGLQEEALVRGQVERGHLPAPEVVLARQPAASAAVDARVGVVAGGAAAGHLDGEQHDAAGGAPRRARPLRAALLHLLGHPPVHVGRQPGPRGLAGRPGQGPRQRSSGGAALGRGGGSHPAGARLLVLNPDVPRDRLITYTSAEGARLTFADLYTRDYLYTLPVLFLAAARGNSAITYLLLKYGASPASRTPWATPAAHRRLPDERRLGERARPAGVRRPDFAAEQRREQGAGPAADARQVRIGRGGGVTDRGGGVQVEGERWGGDCKSVRREGGGFTGQRRGGFLQRTRSLLLFLSLLPFFPSSSFFFPFPSLSPSLSFLLSFLKPSFFPLFLPFSLLSFSFPLFLFLPLFLFPLSLLISFSFPPPSSPLLPSLPRLQEQLVLDCFATFEPPARPEPDPVTSSNRDLAQGPTRQPSNLLKRLQGVANRDKVVGTIGSSLKGAWRAGGRATSAARRRRTPAPPPPRQATSSPPAASGAAAGRGPARDTTSGARCVSGTCSARVRGVFVTPFPSSASREGSLTHRCISELTWEIHLGSRRRIRQLHEEGMDSETAGKTTVVEAERSISLLKRLSSNPECLGFIVKNLFAVASNVIDFYERCTENQLHTCFNSLLHNLLKRANEVK